MDEQSDDTRPCPNCGATATVEIDDEHQQISICADCGSDQ